MIEKGNTCVDVPFASAIEIKGYGDFRFTSFTVDFGNAISVVGHR
jgi:hypothetical protein